jgi:hypothetical protein
MNCKCETEQVQPNATPDTPWFPGIVRFPTTRVLTTSPECGEHGFRIGLNVAAIIRYAD